MEGEKVTTDMPIECLNGWFSVTASPLRNHEGTIIGAIHIARDITEQKRLEETLRESRNKYQAIFESTGTATLIVEEDTTIMMANNECYSVTGYTPNELIGQKWVQYVAPESLQIMLKNRELRRQNHDLAPKKYDVTLVNKIGEKRDALLDISTIPGTKQSVVSILDITESKRAEEEIKRTNEKLQLVNAEKDKFFSIIAHDLRTPFNSFLGLTQIMAEQLPAMTLQQTQKIAVSMRKTATNLYGFLENLLQWSRMQQGITTFEPQLLLLMPKISESFALYLEAFKSKRIDINYDISEDVTVFTDGNMFDSIVRNLVSNAIKFTPQEGKITITAKSLDENWVKIFVKDSGIGMNREMVENLFRKDINTNRKGTNSEPSSGLGLIICKEFIEKHGGKLWADSEEGKGSTFYFTLPAKAIN